MKFNEDTLEQAVIELYEAKKIQNQYVSGFLVNKSAF